MLLPIDTPAESEAAERTLPAVSARSGAFPSPAARWIGRPQVAALFCAVLTALAFFAIHPTLAMGTTDDWSYARTALEFAQTGHMIYNGWATAMLGWQIVWGALFIKLFGFSFFVLRLSTLPFAMGCAYLLYTISVRFGLRAANAALVTLTTILSPLFLPLACSYMTDVPAFFWLLVTLYACLRALSSVSTRASLGWLVFATAVNVIAGSARQIVWLGALVMVPSAAFLLRRRRPVLPVAAALWLASLAAIWACMKWFAEQPYSLPEKIIAGHFSVALLPHLAQQLRDLVLTLFLLSLPVLAAYLFVLRGVALKRFALFFTAALLFLALHAAGVGVRAFAPWLPYVVSPYGVGGAGSWENLGVKDIVLTPPLRVLLSVAVLASACAWLAAGWPRLRSLALPFNEAKTDERSPLDSRRIAILLGPFVLAYFALLLPRATFGLAVDRYLLPLIGLFTLVVLRSFQFSFERATPKLCFALMALYAAYGVAVTHDYFVLGDARLAAATSVVSAGIPRTAIQGGWEYDGWTQITTAGYIDEPRLVNPPGAYQRIPRLQQLPAACRFEFAQLTPAVDPHYFVVFSPQSCLAPSRFAAIPYRTWLPPFRHQIDIQQLPAAK